MRQKRQKTVHACYFVSGEDYSAAISTYSEIFMELNWNQALLEFVIVHVNSNILRGIAHFKIWNQFILNFGLQKLNLLFPSKLIP